MREIREKASTPVAEDFRNDGGTPIVVDTVAQVAYAIDATGGVFALSGAAGGGITNINVSAGTTSNNLSKLTFSNGSGVSFGLNGSVITATVATNYQSAGAYLTTAMLSNQSTAFAGIGETTTTQAGTAMGLTVNTDGVNIAYPVWLTTAQPPGAYLTTAMASNAGSNFAGLGETVTTTAGTDLKLTVASDGVQIAHPVWLTTAQAPGAYLTTAMLSNASTAFAGIGETTGTTAGTDLKMTVDTAGVNISFPKWITTAAASDHSHGNPTLALTNLTGTTASASNGFTLSLSAAAPGAGGGAAISAGANSQNTGTVNFANSNGVTFGLSNNGTMTASHNGLTTAAASDHSHGNPTLALTNLSGTTASASNGLTLSLSAAAPGGGAGNTVSYYANAAQFLNSQTMTFLQSTSHILPFVVDQNLSFAYMRLAASGSVLAASSTAATTGNTSYTAGHFRSHNLVIYSRGAGASSMSLQSVLSTQVTEAFRQTQSHAANSTQHSYTLNYTFPCSSGTTGFTKNYSSSAASLNYHTSQLTDLTGIKLLEIPFAGSLSPGRYWLAYGISSTTSTQRTADQSRQGVAFTMLGMSQGTLAFGTLGAATNSSMMPFQPSGSFTTAGGGTTASIEMTRVSSSASQNQLFFQLMRVT